MSDPSIEIKLVGDEAYLQQLEDASKEQPTPAQPEQQQPSTSAQEPQQQPARPESSVYPDTGRRRPDWFPDESVIDRINDAFKDTLDRKRPKKKPKNEPEPQEPKRPPESSKPKDEPKEPRRPEPPLPETPKPESKKEDSKPEEVPRPRPEPTQQPFEDFEKHAQHRLSDIFSPAVVRRWTDHFFGRGLLGQVADTVANNTLKKTRLGGKGRHDEAEQKPRRNRPRRNDDVDDRPQTSRPESSDEPQETPRRNNDRPTDDQPVEERPKSFMDRLSDFLKRSTPQRQQSRKEVELQGQRQSLQRLRERADRQIRFLTGKDTKEDREAKAAESQEEPSRNTDPETIIGKFTDSLARGTESIEKTFINTTRQMMLQVRGLLTKGRRAGLRARRQVGRGLERVQDSPIYRRARITQRRLGRRARQVGNEVAESLGRTRIGRAILGAGQRVGSAARGVAQKVGFGGSASGGGGASAASRLAGIARVAGPFAIGLAAGAAALLGLAAASRKVVQRFTKQADELEEYSGAIVAARLKIEAERIKNTIDRTRKLETPVARVEGARGRLEDALFELSTEFKESFSKLAPIVEVGVDSLTAVVTAAQVVINKLQEMADYAQLDLEQIIGIDFGWDHPTAAMRLAHDRDNDCIYVIGEYAQREYFVHLHLHRT